jgi:hypothetical protein
MVLAGAYGGLRLGDVSLLCWKNLAARGARLLPIMCGSR